MKAFKHWFKAVDPNLKPDPDQLQLGIKVELEHTPYKSIAKIIAMHHLAEDPMYYTKLKKIESTQSKDS